MLMKLGSGSMRSAWLGTDFPQDAIKEPQVFCIGLATGTFSFVVYVVVILVWSTQGSLFQGMHNAFNTMYY